MTYDHQRQQCAGCGREYLAITMHDIHGAPLCQRCCFSGYGDNVANDEQAERDEADYNQGQYEQDQGP